MPKAYTLIGEWVEEVKQLRAQGMSWTAITQTIIDGKYPELSGLNFAQVTKKARNVLDREKPDDKPVVKQSLTPAPKLIDILRTGAAIEDIAKRLNVTSRVASAMVDDERDKGYNVQEKDGKQYISKIAPPTENVKHEIWRGEKIIRFGLMGDTQINSKYTQLTHLHSLYDLYKTEGISTVYHSGDIDEGEHMRSGQEYENYNQGADDHINEIVKVYPKREGIITQFITGNHDHSFIKGIGLDIGVHIAKERKDMLYLGQSAAVIYLTENCTLELRHPIDGTAYAISYKTQKMIESMSGGEKPNILAVGHYHKAEYIFYRNIHCFQTATTCAQTPWMRGKQISAHMGGWIVEVHVNDDGTVERIKQEFIPFYSAIKNDYLNWR